MTDSLDEKIEKIVPHLEHQVCQPNCPNYQIQALIADQCRLARIDELEGFLVDEDGGYFLTYERSGGNISDRIKTLEEEA